MEYCNDFRYDLKFGQKFEDELGDIINNSKIEIKTDKMALTTGNICIELMSRGKPSGLRRTEADYWLYNFYDEKADEVVFSVFISTKKLKQYANKYIEQDIDGRAKRLIYGGDNNSSLCVLIPFKELLYYNTLQPLINE